MTKRPKRKDRVARDAAYRAALGLPPDEPLPSELGQTGSAGSGRGGRNASHGPHQQSRRIQPPGR